MGIQPITALRGARPTTDDGLAYGRYLDALVPGFRMTLGRRRIEIVAAAFLQPGHDLSYEHVTFAEHDGAIVGVVSGYTAQQHLNSAGAALRRAAGGPLERAGAAFLVWFLRRFGPDADGEFYVWALAVDKDRRRQGIGSALMDFAEAYTRAAGLNRLSLDVGAKNEAARSFYEGRGMVVKSQWPALPFVPAATIRMVKRL